MEQQMGIRLEGHELLLGSDQSVEDQLHIGEGKDAIARRGNDHHRATNAPVGHPRGIRDEEVSQEAEGVATEKQWIQEELLLGPRISTDAIQIEVEANRDWEPGSQASQLVDDDK